MIGGAIVGTGGVKGLKGSLPGHLHYGIQGPPGGHYIPEAKQVEGGIVELKFIPSSSDLPPISSIRITLPVNEFSVVVDRVTGYRYKLFVENGRLMMEEYDADAPVVTPGSGVNIKVDETLTLSDDGTLSVNTTDVAESSNPLPITSSGVRSAVGNIEILMRTI